MVDDVAHEWGRVCRVRSGEKEAGTWAVVLGRSKMNTVFSYLLNIFSSNLNFKCFKGCLPALHNFQINCGFVQN
jgi:hypothetical protein